MKLSYAAKIKMAASSGAESSSYICLSKKPLRFDPVSRENSVFFDEANKQVSVYHKKVCLRYFGVFLNI
jgi:hypothetical protein